MNTIRFPKLSTTKLRILFTNKDKARSGVTEVEKRAVFDATISALAGA